MENYMKCTRCRERAEIRMPSHNLKMCPKCFDMYFKRQIERALKKFKMLDENSVIAMGVSGGKDSMALWRAMSEMKIEFTAFHIELGLGEFSEKSKEICTKTARELGTKLKIVSLKRKTGMEIGEIVKGSGREFCSVCGTVKRQIMNSFAKEEGCNVLCSGHNLDDEAARLLGNLIYKREEYVKNTWPVLKEKFGKLPRKIKPLIRLDSHEIRSFVKIKNIEYLPDKCPKSKGATSHIYQDALDQLEKAIPGIKRNLYFGYLNDNFDNQAVDSENICRLCKNPSYGEICAACNLIEKAKVRINGK